MKLIYHGGACCGVKQIYSLGLRPEGKVCAETYVRYDATDGTSPARGQSFISAQAPTETAAERLKRLVAYAKSKRENGIIEVITADAQCYGYAPDAENLYNQFANWHKTLVKMGFKLVSSCCNSNSGNRIYIYHLIFDNQDDDVRGGKLPKILRKKTRTVKKGK